MGLSADIPALKDAELGWDYDTKTLRVGNESPNPYKILTTGSTGEFVFPYATVRFNSIQSDNINGVDFNSLTSEAGVLVSLGNGSFLGRSFTSNDGSVLISNGDGQNGDIDLSVSTETIAGALTDIRNDIIDINTRIDVVASDIGDRDSVIDNLVLLSGRPANSNSLGTFPVGSIIPDNVSIRTALEALDNAVSTMSGGIPINIDIEYFDPELDQYKLKLNNNNFTIVPEATETTAGALGALDKVKLNLISASTTANLDDLQALPVIEDRLDALEAIAPTTYYELIDASSPVWFSDEDVTEGLINQLSVIGFRIVIDRIGSVTGENWYDEVTLNGTILLEGDWPIHTKTHYITVFKKDEDWFVLRDGLVCEHLNEPDPDDILFRIIASNNSVRVFTLQAI